MKVDKATLLKIAHLSRLEVDERMEKNILTSLTDILDWVEKLNEVDTSGVEPLTNMSWESNVLREDRLTPHLSHEQGLKNAPKKDADYFRVPKVME